MGIYSVVVQAIEGLQYDIYHNTNSIVINTKQQIPLLRIMLLMRCVIVKYTICITFLIGDLVIYTVHAVSGKLVFCCLFACLFLRLAQYCWMKQI